MSTITINGVEFDADEIRKAKWETEISNPTVGVATSDASDDRIQKVERVSEDEGRYAYVGTLLVAEYGEDPIYDFARAVVRDVNGNAHTLMTGSNTDYSYERMEDGERDYPNGDENNLREVLDEDGGTCYGLGDVCETMPKVDWRNAAADMDDYRATAEYYVKNLPDTARFYLDTERGFANEWTLYVDKGGNVKPDDTWARIGREKAAFYMADAIASQEAYMAEYLAAKCVAAYEIEA